MANIYDIVSEQFPEFVRANHPKIIQFIEAYYRWVEQQSIGKIEDVVNIDTTSAAFIQYFRNQLDKFGLFASTTPLDLKYLRYIKQIYASKGSEQALLFLLRVAFNNALVDIRYPSESMLRASDGQWSQQSFITLRRRIGTLTDTQLNDIKQFNIILQRTQQVIRTTSAVAIEVTPTGEVLELRLLFDRIPGVVVAVDQEVHVTLNNDSVVFEGTVVPSPSRIQIASPGADWAVGQLIQMPGSILPTIIRITRIDSTGGILATEIVQHGYDHPDPQTLIATPYRGRPFASVFIDTVPNGPLPQDGDTHTITITDYTDGADEFISGTQSNPGPVYYFAENYAAETYAGNQAIDVAFQATPIEQEGFDPSIPLDRWLASRAALRLEFSPLVHTKGSWLSAKGQVSNQNIRLQDNFYYQQFSYVIDSNVNPSQYDSIASTIHPAGMKRFDLYTLTSSLTTEPEVTIAFPFTTLNLIDIENTEESVAKIVTKGLSDETSNSDSNRRWSLTKVLSPDTASIGDSDLSKLFTKRPTTDSVTTTDPTFLKSFTKQPTSDSTSIADTTIQRNLTKSIPSDTVTISETLSVTFDKYISLQETVSLSDSGQETVATTLYDSESYFAESYAANPIVITLQP